MGVQRFAPAEFEGPIAQRPSNDPLDRDRSTARQYLAQFSSRIESAVFTCGVLYERFQPGGLRNSGVGIASSTSGEGDYIMNCRNMTAQVPCYDANNIPDVTVCMTAMQDVAQFVTRSLDLPHWPAEMQMCGERIMVRQLIALVQDWKGTYIPSSVAQRQG